MRKLFTWIATPMLVLLFTMNLTYALTYDEVNFADVENDDPSSEGIMYLKEQEVLHGYPDGTFKSQNKINRAEFLKIVVASLEDFDPSTENGRNCFSDVNDEWFAKYVCYAKAEGIISGYSDGTFKPANNINFAEASKIVVNAFGINPANVQSSDPWYRTFVEPLAEKRAIPDSISDLDKFIARGEMAEVVYRVKDNHTEKYSLKYHDLEGVPVSGQSCDVLMDLFQESAHQYHYYEDDMMIMEEAVESDAVAAPQAVSSRKVGGASDDFSETNIQVQGVDEADIVKNDGRYIYVVNGGEIRIIDAYPAETMKEVTKFKMKEEGSTAQQLYLNDGQLIVVGTQWHNNRAGITPLHWYPDFHKWRTIVEIYNLTDITNPRLTRRLEFDGSSQHSRRVGDTMYLVLNQHNSAYGNVLEKTDAEGLLPRFNDSVADGEERFFAGCDDLMYFPRVRSLNYVIAVAIPLDSNDAIESEVMLGNSENIYASQDNLYVASTNYDNPGRYYHDWNNAKTVVYRYALSPGDIKYESRGKVPGTILNQFSMDESKGFFRIATTKGNLWGSGEHVSKNNLYVLNLDMDITGSIEDIAPGEKIYSTRFMGDRGYMVTFKKVDPLFAFDLSDPYNPKILGKLKIPGYSDYLHPYDENHIIGFGKDAVAASEDDTNARSLDFAWYQGMKIALFDVTDPTNPRQLFTELIGDRGTQSSLLYDHKALLFDREKNLLAFPVKVAEIPGSSEKPDPTAWGETVFDGAYVYTLDLENGFQLRGKITHYSQEDEDFLKQGDYWYGDYLKEIRRILYIGKNLYTVADGGVKASDIDTVEEKNYLELQRSFNYEDEIYEGEMEPLPTPGGIIRTLFR